MLIRVVTSNNGTSVFYSCQLCLCPFPAYSVFTHATEVNYSFSSTKWSETCTTTLILLISVSFETIWGGGCNMHFYRNKHYFTRWIEFANQIYHLQIVLLRKYDGNGTAANGETSLDNCSMLFQCFVSVVFQNVRLRSICKVWQICNWVESYCTHCNVSVFSGETFENKQKIIQGEESAAQGATKIWIFTNIIF